MSARDDARIDWKNGMKYKDIAERYGVSVNTVKSWATRYWNKDRVACAQKKVARKEKGCNPTQNASEVVYEALSDTVEDNTELNEQQKDFCVYYVQNNNQTAAYMRAYGCSYASAAVSAHHLLKNPKIQAELQILRQVKRTAISCLCADDIVEMHMRIAFANITDFVTFQSKKVPVLDKMGHLVYITDPETNKKGILTRTENEILLRDSECVDGTLINEISQGKNGVKIKLADRNKSLEFLERYFELNPQDKHRRDYDNARLEIERERLAMIKDKYDIEVEDTDETDEMIYGEEIS